MNNIYKKTTFQSIEASYYFWLVNISFFEKKGFQGVLVFLFKL
jgi:hypothetical protein